MEATTNTATVSTPTVDQLYEQREQAIQAECQAKCEVAGVKCLADTPMYRTAPAALKPLLELDQTRCVEGDGLNPWEYLAGILDYEAALTVDKRPDAAAYYLAENHEGGYEQSVAHFQALAHGEESQADVDTDLEPATPEPEPGKPDQAAEQAAADARAKQEAIEQAEQQARTECQTTLKAIVTAYRKGERAYRDGLLESGRLCQVYITGRLVLGDKRAAAVQAIEGQLAAYATDTVDVSKLLGCWAAWSLLADEQGLSKAAANVPYGHYRDAWRLLVERANKDTAQEQWVLLPGLEAECRKAYKAAVDGGLGRDAGRDLAQSLVREYAARQKAAADAADAKARADKQAADKAAQEAGRLQQAKQEAAAQAARQAREAAEGTDEERAAAALATHQQATADAEAARRAKEAADFKAQQAARDEATAKKAKAEQDRLQALADARAKVKADKQAKLDEAKAATVKEPADGCCVLCGNATGCIATDGPHQGKRECLSCTKQRRATPTDAECRATNLLSSMAGVAKAATAKDYGPIVAGAIRAHAEPGDVLRAALLDLFQNPPQGMSPEDVVGVLVRTMGKVQDEMPPAEQAAIKAARAALKGQTPAPTPSTSGVHAA